MTYYDVSIPLKLKTLTYKHEQDSDLEGFAVQVPLRNKIFEGIVINKREQKPSGIENIKSIKNILGKSYNKKFIDFINWMSFHYISEPGSILRATFFNEIVELLKGKKIKNKKNIKNNFKEPLTDLNSISVEKLTLDKIVEAINAANYKTLLIHCPNAIYELKLIVETIKYLPSNYGSAILICPEIKDSERLYSLITNNTDENAVLLHSELSKFDLLSSLEQIISGRAKIIVGTRIAIFAPARKISLIMVTQESSWLYKAEETPRYHTRDCAVMRGFTEGCPVVLSDFLPSVNSYFNALKGKFDFIDDFRIIKHPEIKILRQPFDSIFAPEALLNLKLLKNENLFIVAPRTGYSLLRCTECGQIIRCKNCNSTMIFHKEKKTIECKNCHIFEIIPQQCSECGGYAYHTLGTGTERLIENIKQLLSEKESDIREFDLKNEQLHGIFIGKASKVKKTLQAIFKAAFWVDFDFFLSIPDYRAMENAFNKILSLCHLISSDGIIYIQTHSPENEFFKFVKKYDFKKFYLTELKRRQEIGFPPYARLIKVKVSFKGGSIENKIEKLKKFFKENVSETLIGPIKVEKDREFTFILRSREKKKLTEEVNKCLSKINELKGINLKLEVDPVSLNLS